MAESASIKNNGVRVSVSAAARSGGAGLSMRSFTQAMSRVGAMTESNDHTGALRAVARYFKYNDLTERLEAVSREHIREGSMSWDNLQRRNQINDELLERIGREYGEDVRRRVYRNL